MRFSRIDRAANFLKSVENIVTSLIFNVNFFSSIQMIVYNHVYKHVQVLYFYIFSFILMPLVTCVIKDYVL